MYAIAPIVLAFTLWTAWRALTSTILHRWWWAFVCLLGAPVTTINLATGEVTTSVFSFTLLGVGYWRVLPDGPAFVSLAFPLGAMLFLHRRRRLLRAARPMMPEDQLP